MNVGIIEAGYVGGALAVLGTKIEHNVLACSRHPDILDPGGILFEKISRINRSLNFFIIN